MKTAPTVAEVNSALECDAHEIVGAARERNGELKIHEINFHVVCRTHALRAPSSARSFPAEQKSPG